MAERKQVDLNKISTNSEKVNNLSQHLEGDADAQSGPFWPAEFAASGGKTNVAPSVSQYTRDGE